MTETFTTFETGYSFIPALKEPKIYYSSAWTGRISREEQVEILIKKCLAKKIDDQIIQTQNDLFLFGSSFEKNGQR